METLLFCLRRNWSFPQIMLGIKGGGFPFKSDWLFLLVRWLYQTGSVTNRLATRITSGNGIHIGSEIIMHPYIVACFGSIHN